MCIYMSIYMYMYIYISYFLSCNICSKKKVKNKTNIQIQQNVNFNRGHISNIKKI